LRIRLFGEFALRGDAAPHRLRPVALPDHLWTDEIAVWLVAAPARL